MYILNIHINIYSIISDITTNTMLDGFYQTSKYFDKYRNIILEKFKLDDEEMNYVNNIINTLKEKYHPKL